MNTKFVDLTELYKLGFHKEIVIQKHLGDQGVCHTGIEKFYRRTYFSQRALKFKPCNFISSMSSILHSNLTLIEIENKKFSDEEKLPYFAAIWKK